MTAPNTPPTGATTPAPTLPLDSPDAVLATAGGKGASLSLLAREGVDVPDGFHVTTAAYRRFVDGARIAAPLAREVAATDPHDPRSLDRAAARARELFLSAPVPDDVADPVRAAYAHLTGRGPAPAVAVRSSATAEDLPDLSFAGQQETYLNIRGERDLLDAVRRCWASLWTARAIGYRALHDVPSDGIALAVVVQRLVDADAAGVLFTRDPVTGDRERIVLNASWGLGEAVVSGLVTPDTVVVDRASLAVTEEHRGAKEVMTVRDTTGTHEVPVPEERRDLPVLAPEEAADLARTALRIEGLLGTAVDVEWAREGDRLRILQARPVTVAPPAVSAPADGTEGEREVWNDTLDLDQLWTSTNVGEALPGVMTPATWSLTRRWLALVMPASGIPRVRLHANIGGRWYVNYSVSAAFGTRGAVAQAFGTVPEGVEIPPPVPSRPVLYGRLTRHVLSVLPGHLPYLRDTDARVREVPRLCEDVRHRIGAAGTSDELARVWREHVEPMIEHVGRLVWASTRSGGVQMVSLRPWLTRRGVSEADANALSNVGGPAPGGQGGTGSDAAGPDDRAPLASLGPLVGIALLARGEIDRDTYVRLWGHRCPDEFEVSEPRPAEDPGWIDRQVEGMRGVDVGALLSRQDDERTAALARFAARHPRDLPALRRRLVRVAAFYRAREQGRSEWMRAVGVTRAFLLRVGEVTGVDDDVFFLDQAEFARLLTGDRSPLEHVPARRAAHAHYRSLPSYPRLIRGRFDPERWAADPGRRTDLYDATSASPPPPPADGPLKGVPGAAGVVEGLVRVVSGPAEGERLLPGEVLVASVTNVGWTPLFPRAAAVVTDVGAALSHAAIVARELGLPAVVGCGDATTRLSTGDRVRVDGGAGTVEVLARG